MNELLSSMNLPACLEETKGDDLPQSLKVHKSTLNSLEALFAICFLNAVCGLFRTKLKQ